MVAGKRYGSTHCYSLRGGKPQNLCSVYRTVGQKLDGQTINCCRVMAWEGFAVERSLSNRFAVRFVHGVDKAVFHFKAGGQGFTQFGQAFR